MITLHSIEHVTERQARAWLTRNGYSMVGGRWLNAGGYTATLSCANSGWLARFYR